VHLRGQGKTLAYNRKRYESRRHALSHLQVHLRATDSSAQWTIYGIMKKRLLIADAAAASLYEGTTHRRCSLDNE
jgi:hypothetical protein